MRQFQVGLSHTYMCIHSPQRGFSGVTVVKNPPANAEEPRNSYLIPGPGRGPGVGNGNLLQSPCLEHSMHREAWQVTVPGVSKSLTGLSGEHAFSSQLPSQRGCHLTLSRAPCPTQQVLAGCAENIAARTCPFQTPYPFPPGKPVSSLTSCKGS